MPPAYRMLWETNHRLTAWRKRLTHSETRVTAA